MSERSITFLIRLFVAMIAIALGSLYAASLANGQTVIYEDGTVFSPQDGEILAYSSSPSGLGQSTMFGVGIEVGDDRILASVDVAVLYEAYFNDKTRDTDKNYTLRVYGAASDGSVGALLLELVREDGASPPQDLPTLTFDTVDLTPYLAELYGHRKVFVAVADAGADDNYVMFPLSPYTGTGETPGVLYFTFNDIGLNWAPFTTIYQGDNQIFKDLVPPIRATLISTAAVANEGSVDLPSGVSLDQNYPNPFNPQTTISYEISEPGHVRLEVYDAQGSLVSSLVNGFRNSGTHDVQFNAADLPSGVYFYTMIAGGQRMTRILTLLR